MCLLQCLYPGSLNSPALLHSHAVGECWWGSRRCQPGPDPRFSITCTPRSIRSWSSSCWRRDTALAVWLSALVLGLPWPPSWVLAGCELCSSQPDTYQQQLTAPRTNSLCWREVIADAAQVPPPLHRHHRPRAATEGHYLILKEIMEKETHQVFLLKVSNRIHKSTFCSSYLFWTVSSII